MTNKKYELTEESKTTGNTTLYRIKALRDFRGIKAGDLGGWIEKEANLSHDNDCWVYDDAQVEGNARIEGNALVGGNATVYDDAQVGGYVRVKGNARIEGNALVCEGEYTSTVINLPLPQYSITVLSTGKLQIGCQLRTIEEWKTTTLEQAVGMGLKEENYELFMKYINMQ